MPPAVWFTLQTVEVNPQQTWLDLVDRYGLPLTFLLITGFVFRWLYLGALRDRDRERDRADMLEDVIREKTLPAMLTSTEATKRVIETLPEVTRLLPRLEAIMLDLERQRNRGQ